MRYTLTPVVHARRPRPPRIAERLVLTQETQTAERGMPFRTPGIDARLKEE